MMLFNPLFIQNSPAEGAANLKQNKLNPNGYLFSDIINVYMGNEEGMDSQVNEFNGEQLKTIFLNLEKEIPINTDSESIKNKFKQLEKYLLQFSNGSETDNSGSEITVENQNVSLKEIKEIFANLVDGEIVDESAELKDEDFASIINKLNNGDGISISFVGGTEVVNINISKEVAEDLTKLSQEGSTKIFQLNFSIVHDGTNASASQGEGLSQILPEGQSEVSFVSKPSLKIYSYQKNDEQTNNNLIDLTKLPAKTEEMYTSTKSINNHEVFNSAKKINTETETSQIKMQTSAANINEEAETKSVQKQTAKLEYNSDTKLNQKGSEAIVANESNKTAKGAVQKDNIEFEAKIAELKNFVADSDKNVSDNKESILHKPERSDSLAAGKNKENSLKNFEQSLLDTKETKQNNNDQPKLTKVKSEKSEVVDKKEILELQVKEEKETKSKSTIENTSVKEEAVSKVELKENIKSKDITENNTKAEFNTKTEEVKTELSNQQNLNRQNDDSKQSLGNFNNIDVNTNNKVEKSVFELPQNQTADRIIKSTEILKEISNFIQKGEKTSIEFQVEPEQLGKLKITLDFSEQAVKANIKVESEAVKYLVESNIQDLQNHLSKQGIQLGSVNISLNENNQKDARNFASKKKSQTEIKNHEEVNSEEEKKEARMLGYNTVEYLA